MRKIIFVCALALFLAPTFAMAERVLGCDFDSDSVEDFVNTRGCKFNAELQRVVCRNVVVKISSGDNYTQNINFTENKSKARKGYSNFVCKPRENRGGTDLFAVNRRGVEERIRNVKSSAPDGINAICNSIRSLRSCEIWKSEASEHIPSFDPRSNSTSLIALRGCPGTFPSCIQAYDQDGNLVHKIGEYPNSISSYDSRHYGGTGCGDKKTPASVAALARKNTGSSEIYVKDAQGACARIPEPTRCYNSSKC